MQLIRPMIAMAGLTALLVALAACRIPVPEGASDSGQGLVQSGNLLPNASFELPWAKSPASPATGGTS